MSVLVTILSWNRINYLKKTIDSFMSRHSNIKYVDYLAWDNGSTDGSVELLKSRGIETLESPTNIGIFRGTKELWLRAFDRGYKFVINIQDDFPCIRKLPLADMLKYMKRNDDVGFILLNDKSRVIKIRRNKRVVIKRPPRKINIFTREKLRYGKWKKVGNTYFVKFNHQFTFNPTLVRTDILPGIMNDNPKPRERGIVEGFHKTGLLAAKTKRPYFDTILKPRHKDWRR